MATFVLGLVILFVGAAIYGKFCEKVFGPDDRETPAYSKQDGVDYVPMRGWKNGLINLLNIAGTGPIIGPIQGILFGPIAFITIPIGNVIGGAMHDYFSGMICLRDGGTQMPDMIRKYSNKGIYGVYQVFLSVLLLLVGAVFIYTPGDIAATQVFNFSGKLCLLSDRHRVPHRCHHRPHLSHLRRHPPVLCLGCVCRPLYPWLSSAEPVGRLARCCV